MNLTTFLIMTMMILSLFALTQTYVFPVNLLAKIKKEKIEVSKLAPSQPAINNWSDYQLNYTINSVKDFRVLFRTSQINGTSNVTNAQIMKELEHLMFLSRPRYG